MTQHIISELACLVGEMAELQSDQARLAEKQAGMQSRLGRLIRDLSSGTSAVQISAPAFRLEPSIWTKAAEDIERESARVLRAGLSTRPERAQAAPPPIGSPSAQDEARPVQVGKALDASLVGDVGGSFSTNESRECRHDAGAGGESAASADTAPAPDANKAKRKTAAKPADPIAGSAVDPVAPRRPPAIQAEGGGLVQDGGSTGETRGDQVLNLWAETTLTQDEIARKLKVNSGTPAAYLSTARRLADSRALKGDLARAALRPPRHEMPEGKPAIINIETGQITGSSGSWTADRAVAKAINVLADGQLYDTSRMAKVSGIKEDAIIASMGIWASALAKIGVELRYQRGYGCRLLAIRSEAA